MCLRLLLAFRPAPRRVWTCNYQGAILIELMAVYDDRAEYMKDHWNVLDVLAFVFCGSAFVLRVLYPDSLWGRALYAAGACVRASAECFAFDSAGVFEVKTATGGSAGREAVIPVPRTVLFVHLFCRG